jgi:uncharacterized protein YecE (DUF72 family)
VGPRAYIGTSGWSYDGWRDGFYRGVPRRQWLPYAAARFRGLEINATHYREQRPETLAAWRDATPPAFHFALKAHRFITHYKKLREVGGSIDRARDNAAALGDKLAVVLWQLPESFPKDAPRLAAFLDELGRWPARHAFELRHRSWFDDEVAGLLCRHRAAVVLSDLPGVPLWDAVTTDLVYVRLHGHTTRYASRYSRANLARWAARIQGWLAAGRNVHVYFDNDARGHAPFDALALRALLGEEQPLSARY